MILLTLIIKGISTMFQAKQWLSVLLSLCQSLKQELLVGRTTLPSNNSASPCSMRMEAAITFFLLLLHLLNNQRWNANNPARNCSRKMGGPGKFRGKKSFNWSAAFLHFFFTFVAKWYLPVFPVWVWQLGTCTFVYLDQFETESKQKKLWNDSVLAICIQSYSKTTHTYAWSCNNMKFLLRFCLNAATLWNTFAGNDLKKPGCRMLYGAGEFFKWLKEDCHYWLEQWNNRGQMSELQRGLLFQTNCLGQTSKKTHTTMP